MREDELRAQQRKLRQRLRAVSAGELTQAEVDTASAAELLETLRGLPLDELVASYEMHGAVIQRRWIRTRTRQALVDDALGVTIKLG